MKETRMDNPEIIVKDSRILELDRVVNEVKESEEWEAVRMNILEIGIENGAKMKLTEQIKKKLAKGYNVEEIAEMLEETLGVIEEIVKELENS